MIPDLLTLCHFMIVAINSVASVVVIWYALCALNAAHWRTTPWGILVSFILLGLGAIVAFVNPPDRNWNGLGSLLMVVALALGFFANRRRCGCLNCPVGDSDSRRRDHAHVG